MATDDLGSKFAENRVSVNDSHAAILHLLVMNYRDLAYERQGLSERLTDQFAARVVSQIIACIVTESSSIFNKPLLTSEANENPIRSSSRSPVVSWLAFRSAVENP